MARVLITGGSSYLGQHLVPLAQVGHEVCYTFFSQDVLNLPGGRWLDVRDETAVSQLVTTFYPDAIIHTVGSNRGKDMRQVIEAGTRHVTQAAADIQARLIHLSTDSIFNGRIDDPHPPPYDESAPPSPVNDYGRAKANAETIVSQHANQVIVRTSLIYGPQQMAHGTAWMANALQAGQPVTLFNNQMRNPVWVQTLSLACLELISHPYRGILNVAGQQTLSRAAFSLKMFDYWGIQTRSYLSVGPTQQGQWPLDCRLALHLASKLLHTPLLGVDEVLNRQS